MTPLEIKALIQSDAEASRLLDAKNDSACAERCSLIAPKLLKETRLSRLGVLSLYGNQADGLSVINAIKAAALSNPLWAEVWAFMQPGNDAVCLPDFADDQVRAALKVSTQSGGLGLTQALADPILRAAEMMQTISPLEVEYVRTRI
jgi:hypothetical protein